MIVKNESKIIERMLTSVIPIIDSYLICDTGSTDNTEEIILSKMREHNKQGKIIHAEFKNFEYNRNIALFSACIMGLGDYLLLMDADMCLMVGKDWNKYELSKWDAISLIQESNVLLYDNLRIVRNQRDIQYRGYTHEYLETPVNFKRTTFSKSQLFIKDVGDGGAKNNKYERDVALLKEGIKEQPENPRYYFYMANTLFDKGHIVDSMPYYEKRVSFGQWFEEVFFSLYRLGLCWKRQGDLEKAHSYFLKAYQTHPLRIESLYELVNMYRVDGKTNLALLYYHGAKEVMTHTTEDDLGKFLFLFKPIYDFMLAYEYTVLAYYRLPPSGGWKTPDGKPPIPWQEMVQVIHKCSDQNILKNMFSNLKFYSTRIPNTKVVWCLTEPIYVPFGSEQLTFYPSTPCLIARAQGLELGQGLGQGYQLNIRYVNYLIDHHTRGYTNYYKNKYIITLNYYINEFQFSSHHPPLHQNQDFQMKNAKILESILHHPDCQYVGVEDVKLCPGESEGGPPKVLGTIQDLETKQLVMGYGDADGDGGGLQKLLLPPDIPQQQTEKNWVFLDPSRIIYAWYPLTILRFPTPTSLGSSEVTLTILPQTEQLENALTYETPSLFKYLRGSSSASFYNNEYYFLCHIVSDDPPRHYYHLFVVLTSKGELSRFSRIFTFHSQPIEFALGLVVEPRRVLCSFSEWDNNAQILEIPKDDFDALFS